MDIDLGNLLNTSSFDNLWYWLDDCGFFARNTYFTLGAGANDVRNAMRGNQIDMENIESLISINAYGLTKSFHDYGVWLLGIVMFFLATIATLGFRFQFELMQH